MEEDRGEHPYQYRLLSLDILERMLEVEKEVLKNLKTRNAPSSYKEKWRKRMEKNIDKMQDGIDNNEWRQ